MSVKNLLAVAVIGATATLVGCGSDDDNNTDSRVGEIGVPCSVGVGTEAGVALAGHDGVSKPVCSLEGRINSDVTLTTDYIYSLNGYVTVGSGFAESGAIDAAEFDEEGTDAQIVAYMKGDGAATLTINAGVEFRSSGRGSLVISRGSEIQANGTAAAPIVMSSLDAGFDGQGEWGGLVLQGFAKNNKCSANDDDTSGTIEADEVSTALICDTADEAGTGFHGGNDDADSSGSISYLIVAEGGYEIAPDSEVNGITLHSVGYGTSIENVMVYNNADDGIEWFGGAANVKNLILVDNGDESLDWDDGFRGNVQYVLARQGVSNEGDHGIEADTDGSNSALESAPVVANVTFQENAEGADDLFRFKKKTNGTLINVAADGYEECVKAEGTGVSVTMVNVVAECTAYSEGDAYLTGDAGAASVQVDGADFPATTFGDNTVTLGNMFEVTSQHTVATLTAADFVSANGSDVLDVTNFLGAVDPAANEAWYAWAEAIIPAAFQ